MDSNANLTDITIPKTEKDITAEWLAKATGMEPIPATISIVSNIQDGVGFLSNMFRVSFDTKSSGSQSIIVKLLPSSPDYLALTLSENFDEREVQFYTIVAPKLLEIAPELRGNLCKIYCGNIINRGEEEHASMLVMEDLKPSGYEMLDPESNNWGTNLENLLDFLAKTHVAGLVLENKEMKISKMFPFCMGVAEMDENNPKPPSEMLVELARTNFSLLDDFLAKHQVADSVRTAYKNLIQFNDSVFLRVMNEGAKLPYLIHGDVWPPNLMVSKNSDLPMKVLDWQLLGYKDVSYELTVAMLTCIPVNQMKAETVDKYCKLYYSRFLQYAMSNGVSGSQLRDEKEFLDFFNTWGMSYAFLWYLLSFESFPNNQDRLLRAFVMLHEEFKVVEFLLKICQTP